jgi:predicted Zn-dependent peptidase
VSELGTLDAHIRQVSVADVHRIAQRVFAPEHSSVVIVGDWARLEHDVVALGWGPIEIQPR